MRERLEIAADFQQHSPVSETLLRRSVRSGTRTLHFPSLGEDALGMRLEKPLRRMGYRRRLHLCAYTSECVCVKRESVTECECVRVSVCDSVRCSCSTEVLRVLQQSLKKERGRERGGEREEERGREEGATAAGKLSG